MKSLAYFQHHGKPCIIVGQLMQNINLNIQCNPKLEKKIAICLSLRCY